MQLVRKERSHSDLDRVGYICHQIDFCKSRVSNIPSQNALIESISLIDIRDPPPKMFS